MIPASAGFDLLCTHTHPATRNRVELDLTDIGGQPIPVEIINGGRKGPVLCLTAAIHGDELNGIEIVRRVTQNINPNTLSGTIVAIPVVNVEGYLKQIRYINQDSDLNRCFPGDTSGSFPDQVAHALFANIASFCDIVIDIHTGSSGRENLPQLRVDLTNTQNANLLAGFKKLVVVQSIAPHGSLREASTDAGIAAMVMEIGGRFVLEPKRISAGIQALESLLSSLKMIGSPSTQSDDQHQFSGGGWIRSEVEGMFISKVELGDEIEAGAKIGKIINPLTSTSSDVTAPLDCTILGQSCNQLIKSGVGIFRVGLK